MTSKRKTKKGKWRIPLLIISIIAAAAAVFALIIVFGFRTKHVHYSGTDRLSDEQLNEYILENKMPNSFIYKFFDKKNNYVPLISSYDVELTSPDTLDITVHEKELVGYIVVGDQKVYVDADGKAADIWDETFDDIPLLEGIEISNVVIGKELPVGEGLLESVKDYGSALKKYGIETDKISFDEDGNVTFMIKDVKVICGNSDYANEKTDRISRLTPEFDGIKGVLDLKGFDGTQKNLYVKTANDTEDTENTETAETAETSEDTEDTGDTEDTDSTEDMGTTEVGEYTETRENENDTEE